MSVGLLLLTHEAMGDALIATARHILGRIPLALEAQINQIVGVIAFGLFAARGANVCLLGTAEGVRTLKF